MADSFVQGGIFGGLNWAPLNFDPTFGPNPASTPSQNSATSPGFGLSVPALPSVGGAATSIPGAAASAGITGGATPPAATSGNPAAGAVASNWFVRGVVVILGFIFVAVGLSQFGVVQRMRG